MKVSHVFCFIAFIALIASAPVSAAVVETFEGTVTYSDGYSANAGGDWAISTSDNGPSQSGSRSVFYAGLANGTSTGIGYVRTQVFTVTPNTNYTISVDYKSNGTTNGYSVGACLFKLGSNAASQPAFEYSASSGTGWSTWTRVASSRQGLELGTWGDNNWRTNSVNFTTGASDTQVTVAYFAVAVLGNLADTFFDNVDIGAPIATPTPTLTPTITPTPPPTVPASAVSRWSLYR